MNRTLDVAVASGPLAKGTLLCLMRGKASCILSSVSTEGNQPMVLEPECTSTGGWVVGVCREEGSHKAWGWDDSLG